MGGLGQAEAAQRKERRRVEISARMDARIPHVYYGGGF
jgi:hypothetical protein